MRTDIGRRAVSRDLGMVAGSLLLAGMTGGWTLAPPDLAVRPGFGFGTLKFRLTDAMTGRTVTAVDFRGRIVMLTFGYSNCTDVCPLTLSHAAQLFHRLGQQATGIRFLFVTVDPMRDTVPALRRYIGAFGAKGLIGLRGSPAELQAVAARMGARYSVHPSSNPEKYQVTHTTLTYVFNRQGAPQFSIADLGQPKVELAAIARDLAHLVAADRV